MHRKIGIIGGLSPESTVSYYLHITRSYIERFGDCGYPEILIYSVNLEQYHRWRRAGRWDRITESLIDAAVRLRRAGADFGLIATNTMHKVFDRVQEAVDLPLIHLVDAVCRRIREKGVATVGLLGTRYTMTDGFYQERLARWGLRTLIPEGKDQETVHRIIVEELVRGTIRAASESEYRTIIERLQRSGAEGVILGCTEIPLLVHQERYEVPLFDTALIHADAALARATGVSPGGPAGPDA